MGIIYTILSIVISSIPIFLVYIFRKNVVLKVPIFSKNYTYEYLKRKYGYHKIKYNIFIVTNILFLFIFFYMIYNIINRCYSVNKYEYVILINSKYWVFPAIMCSVLGAIIIARKAIEKILKEDFPEFLILLYVEYGCYSLKDIIKEIYYINRRIKLWGNLIAIIIMIYSLAGFNMYTSISNNEIIVSSYGEFHSRKYIYSDIEEINETYINKYKNNGLGHNFTISFNDDYIWESQSKLNTLDSATDHKIMNFIEEKSGIKAKEN